MSTAKTQQLTPSAYAPAPEPGVRLSLRALAEMLSALQSRLTFQELTECLRRAEVGREELRPFVGFKAATYARHRVFINEFAELLVLCWRPGQRTPIHDHTGSFGAVRVLAGVMLETMFTLDEQRGLTYRSTREWTGGQVTGADVPDIHQLGNPEVSGQNLITLHLYAPPLTSLNIYKVGRKSSVNTLWMNSWNPTI